MGRSKGHADYQSSVQENGSRQPAPGTVKDHAHPPRNTGIRVLSEMKWGTHICVFYQTKNDLLETVIPYLQAGLNDNEFCVWAVSGPITVEEGASALRDVVPDFDARVSSGQIEILTGREWYLNRDQFDLQRIIDGWNRKLDEGMAKGFDGLRLSGNAFWTATNYWDDFCEYEKELDRTVSGKNMIALCTYPLDQSKAADILDVARSHQCSVARRNGDWEFLESPELKQAKEEIGRLQDALHVLSKPFPGSEALTERERVVLAQIVRGASSKEAARLVGVSPRTIEFHRANIMKKLDAKNPADLVRRVLQGK
jgi:DNA-binding CsgD family transcriptional regulator